MALVALVGCRAPTPPAPPPPAPAPVPARTFDTVPLDAYFKAHFPAAEPGAAVLIAKHGRTIFSGGYGLADLRTGEPITTRTLFNLGSLSKTFVASAILILQER